MTASTRGALRVLLLSATALAGLALAGAAFAEDAPNDAGAPSGPVGEVVVTAARTTRSSVTLGGPEVQKILPGINPLKGIQTLPGVVFTTADPWGNNEQNEALFVHGFSTQQLGYTMDNVPLGDQQYGNYNGLSVSRAVASENVSRVTLSSGAGVLGVASTSNLGGAIETFSSDPLKERTFDVRETVGSYATTRTFLRLDTGTFNFLGTDTTLYLSGLHHDAKAWDFNGHQRDDQVNAKLVSDGARARLTVYFDWDDKVEPNEDQTNYGNQQSTGIAASFLPYTRPFIYPDLAACNAYVAPNSAPAASGGNGGLPGTPPTRYGTNFSNCFSAAQRTDALGYAKLDWKIANGLNWSNQVYYHYDYGRGIVDGPVNQAGLPALFAAYFPSLVRDPSSNPVPITQAGASANVNSAGTLANLTTAFGGSGYAVRTTEYRLNREGLISTADWDVGQNQVEAGLWWEHNEPAQHRAWYPVSAANNDLSPYSVPTGHIITQYFAQFFVNDVQLHIQDQWRILPNLLLQAGWKASLQTINGNFPVEQVNLPTANPAVYYPQGKLTSNDWFLPQVGAVWDVTPSTQLFFNVQKNMRQFTAYGAGGNFYSTAPYSLGTQAAFDLFKSTIKPETAWTYEAGVREKWTFDNPVVTGFDGQVNYYHVNFANRLFNVAPYSFINPAPSIIVNVGGVTTDGVDAAGTLRFGPHFSAYEAISYNKSTYDQNYQSGLVAGVPQVVPIAGKSIPLSPDWTSKTILSTTWGPFDAQITGDYVGRRYVTYLNDLSVPSTFLTGLQAGYRVDPAMLQWLRGARISLNVTNLGNIKGVSTAVVTSATGGYAAFPIAPTMGFVTLQATF